MAKIIIPTPLRKFTKEESTFFTSKKNFAEAIEELSSVYPAIRQNLFDEENRLRKFIKIFIGDKDLNFFEGGNTEINDETVISIIPAIAGGSH